MHFYVFSEQNIVDCFAKGDTGEAWGCHGGFYPSVWSYAASKTNFWVGDLTGKNSVYLPKNFQGMNLLSSYPYKAEVY